ncbi:MAG: ComF family protein [Caldilineae bacterium]|nr:MAG: ComF family protein [Caldilineae bacterium]
MRSGPSTHPKHLLRRWLSALLDTVFPPTCVGCGRVGSLFCAHCAQAVLPTPPPLCPRCGRPQKNEASLCRLCRQDPQPPLRLVRAAALHASPLRAAIHALKYENHPELAESLARYLIAAAMQEPFTSLIEQIHVVIPVPLHDERLATRGYNQSALLARNFAAHWGLPVEETWLRRIRATQSQVGLNATERRQNVSGAFQAQEAAAGKHILLVDDVFTTGSTLNACAAALRQAGAADIVALALATPPPPQDDALPPDA